MSLKIKSDISGASVNMTGPWEYKNAKKSKVHYTVVDREDIGPRFILIQDLLKRGFSKFETKLTNSQKFKWYSWLRFKAFATKDSTVENVLLSKDEFLRYLGKVDLHYKWHKSSIDAEGLEESKGPQNFDDIENKTLLHYYGKGWYK